MYQDVELRCAPFYRNPNPSTIPDLFSGGLGSAGGLKGPVFDILAPILQGPES